MFSSFFALVFVPDDQRPSPLILILDLMPELEIATPIVLAPLKGLSVRKLARHDRLHHRLLKTVNEALVTAVIPPDWQTTIVTSIHKKGSNTIELTIGL